MSRRVDRARFVGIVTLTLMVGLVVAFWVSRIDDPLLAVLTTINLVLCAVGIGRALGGGGTRLLNLLFFVFFLAWIAIPSAYQLAYHHASRDDNALTYNLAVTIPAQFMTASALTSFLLGGWWADRFERRRAAKGASAPVQATPTSSRRSGAEASRCSPS